MSSLGVSALFTVTGSLYRLSVLTESVGGIVQYNESDPARRSCILTIAESRYEDKIFARYGG